MVDKILQAGGMAHRARAKPAAPLSKRERVLTAAARIFLEEGYGAAGMDAIAREADVSKATVYSYYGDKASLFAAVMARMCEDIGGPVHLEGLVGASPEATLGAIALHGLHRLLETVHRQVLQRVVAESREFPELGKKFWEHGPARIEGLLARYLADAKRQGILDVDDPARVAARLVGQVTGLYLLPMLAGVRGRPSEAQIRRDLDDLVAGFLATVRRKK
jgi:TetR/AcrR family transcriptional regulator, mexJK operon transcriptional repressor